MRPDHLPTRSFAGRADWLRLGTVRNEAEARRLAAALTEARATLGW
jgi:cobalamin biosynthetic protein CobC